MNDLCLLFAQRGADSPANRWLAENPLILGLIFLAIGGALLFFGVIELRKGVARDKYGNEISGGMGKFLAIVRIVGGVLCCGFAIYKMAGF